MFKDFNIKRFYRSKQDELDRDFLIPLLGRSIQYDRGTGYFSLIVLANLANGIIPFLKKGGNIRVVTSVDLGAEEREIIKKGLSISEDKIINSLEIEIEKELEDSQNIIKLDLITNLIAAKRLEIRIAYMPEGGIYHEKLGLLTDEKNNKVCFIGSGNETYNGYRKNLESFFVLKSWKDDPNEIIEQQDYFNDLWTNNITGVTVFNFEDALEEKLFNKYKKSSDLEVSVRRFEENFFNQYVQQKGKELYNYQKIAIKEFFNNKSNHFYEMATGTGKTFTAVKTIEQLYKKNKGAILVVVLVPQVDLQEQWRRAFDETGISCYLFGGISRSNDWEVVYDECIIDLFSNEHLTVMLSTYDTYFAKINKDIDGLAVSKMIVVDEAHELSANQILKLPKSFKYRLGLSATPERHNSDETKDIISYFTNGTIETYKYSIDEAINKGFLSHYEYYPIFVHLDIKEFEIYQRYTKKLIYLLNQKKRDLSQITDVSNRRSVIVKKAREKIDKLLEMAKSNNYNFCNSVVYCGQGKEFETDESIIDIVTRHLAVSGNYRVSQFTSRTDNRTRVLAEFENGYYDTLVAIKCFDQGVDVPKLDKIYIMASDSLKRQTVQRRGRVLRQCKKTGKNLAYIYDMIVLPPEGIFNGIGIKSLVLSEFNRLIEYMRIADNRTDIKVMLEEQELLYEIMEEDYGK